MDRFIAVIVLWLKVNVFKGLKSNMDRFIGAENEEIKRILQKFKIQYG